MKDKDKTKRADLLIIYGDLLSETIKRRMEAFYLDDLSYSEIALNENVSRTAIYDSIHEGDLQLDTYEEKLALNQKLTKLRSLIKAFEEEKDEEKRKKLLSEMKGEIEYGI